MTNYGYSRVATYSEKLDEQEQILLDEMCDEVWVEVVGGEKMRPVRDELIAQLKKGDTLVITGVERLSRSIKEGLELTNQLLEKGVKVHVLNTGFLEHDDMRPILKLFTDFSISEREIRSSRIKQGKEIARQREGYIEGRPKKYTSEELEQAMLLLETKTYKEVASLTNISRSTLVREKRKTRNIIPK